MLTILLVFLASFIVIGSFAYILYTYQEELQGESGLESFGIPSRTQTFLDSQKNCDAVEESVNEETEDDEEEEISMEDVLQMRNGKGETVEQKILQKTSGMGYREGPPGPSNESNDRVSKPENLLQTDSKDGLVWAKGTPKPDLPPSHLMGSSNEPSVGGILPGLDREAGTYSPL